MLEGFNKESNYCLQGSQFDVIFFSFIEALFHIWLDVDVDLILGCFVNRGFDQTQIANSVPKAIGIDTIPAETSPACIVITVAATAPRVVEFNLFFFYFRSQGI